MVRWILLSLLIAAAVAAPPIIRSTFDDGPGGWTVMGGVGTVRVTRQAADMHEGKPSLALDYEIADKKLGVAILPVEPSALTAMDQIHFWIKTDIATSVAVILSEKGGGNYSAIAWSPGSVWQEVRLEPHDFTLGERATDPPDPDGRLDLDQLQGVGLADLAQLFSGAPPNPDLPIAVDQHSGKHTLLISGFEVLGGNTPRTDNLSIDQFDAPQLSWLSPGGAALRLDRSREHAPGPALEVSYRATDSGIVFFVRNLPPDIPANTTHIGFDIASENSAQLVFALQEKGSGRGEGPRYNTTVDVRGGGKPDHRELALSAFALDENGPPDPAGELNVVKIKSLAIADISAAANGSGGPNKLWISNLRLITH